MKTKTRFHKLTAWLLTLAMLMTFIPSFTIGVNATENTDYTGYYKIGNAGQLSWFACLVVGDTSQSSITEAVPNANAVLTADIDITILAERFGKTWSGIGTADIPFTGIFDGNGYTIKGLTIDSTLTTPTVATIPVTTTQQGLFGVIGAGGIVRDVILEGTASVSDGMKLGAVCSENNGTIENVLSMMTVTGGDNPSAFVHTNNGTITNCYTNQSGTATGAALVSSQQLEDGSVTYELGSAFGQTINVDTQPVHYDGTNRVYKTGDSYSNTEATSTYTVTVDDSIENGTVETDVSEAEEGDTVTLTVTPADGYAIDTVSYNDGANDVPITATNGIYSFTMPAGDVTVTASFKAAETAPTEPTYSYNMNNISDFMFAVSCVNDSHEVPSEYNFYPSGFATNGEVVKDDEGRWTCDVTVRVKAMFEENMFKGVSFSGHRAVNEFPESQVYTAIWNSETEKWEWEGDTVIYEVTCATDNRPAAPTADNDISAELLRFSCAEDESHVKVVNIDSAYATVGEVTENADGEYICELTWNVKAAWEGSYGADFASSFDAHAPAVALPESKVFSLKYDTESGKWTYSGETASYSVTCATYSVTVADTENGTVEADKTEAAEGDTVTLTITPNEGYALKTLTVDGEDVTENVTDNKYAFEMPAAEVVVTATFAQVYSVTRSVYAGYTINRTADTVLPIKHGDSYAFTVEITDGYAKTAEFAVKAGNKEDAAEDLTALTPDENGVYTINNITSDIKISVVGVSPYKPDSIDDFKVGGNAPLKLVCEADDAHSITAPYFDSAYITVGEINPESRLCEITFNVAKYMEDKLPGHRAAGNMPDNITMWLKWDVDASKWEYTTTRELTVTCAPETYAVSFNTPSNGTVTADKTKAAEGETVTLTITPNKGYKLKSIKAWQSGTEVDISDDYTFIMPASNVSVIAVFAVCDHTDSERETVTNSGDGKHSFICSVCGDTVMEEHSPKYSASGSTITATCSNNCGFSGTATISAIGKTYDGTAVEATVETTGDLADTTIAITYAVKGGTKIESAPANAGTYTASITLGEGENVTTVSVDFEITPVTITPSHTHSLGYKYSDTEHWQECTAEDCPDKEGSKTGLAAHNFDNDCDTDCNDNCGYTRQTSHSPLADWIEGENGHWHDCESCGEDLDFTVHNYKTEWSYDAEWHWHECYECGYGDEVVGHIYDSDADTTCVCGYTRTIGNDDDDTSDTPVITSFTFDSDSPAYNAETNTFTVTKDTPFVVYITGEYFENIDNTFLEETSFGFVPSVEDSENALGNALAVFKDAGFVTIDAVENRIKLTFDYDAMKTFVAEHGRFEGICYGDIVNIKEENIESVNIALAKYDPIYTEPTVKTGLVYNGAEQELLIPGTAEGGTMKYYIGGTQATAEVPTRKAAGEYTVTCIIAGDQFHNNIVVGEYTVSIAKKTLDNAIALTAPVRNEAPQTEITGDGYTAMVVWSPEVTDTFAYNTEYTATVTITPDENHTVTGIAANGYTVEGAKTVTNDENSNIVTVAYEKTGSRPSFSGGSSSTTSTTTTKNEDGSKTVVKENKATGTTTEVTTNTDGSTTTVETKKDGTVTTTEKDKEGNKTVTIENKDGSTVTEETKKDGTKVTTETNADGKTTAEVVVKSETEVVIPIPDAEEVYEVVVTDEKGNETVITDFEVVDGGVAITVDGKASVSLSKGSKKEFVDVHHVDHWSEKSVDYVYIRGLMNGTSESHFSPDATLTRAMLVTVLYRLEGEPAVWGGLPFEDVEEGSYYEFAVAWAKANGIVNGTSATTFEPNVSITREQIAAIMHRYADFKGHDVQVGENTNILSYDDVHHVSEYAIGAMQYAVGSGLINGKTESTLNPLDNATRAEAAAILERFIKAN